MTAALVVAAAILSCLGYGLAAVSTVAGRDPDRTPAETLCIAFAVGYGIVGWLLFFPGVAGHYATGAFAGVGGAGLILAAVFGRRLAWPPGPWVRWNGVAVVLAACTAVVLAAMIVKGLAPPVDADSLNYHFRQPKTFLADGWISFTPRAADGAAPMLTQLINGPLLAFGGETAMTMWAAATAAIAGVCTAVLAARLCGGRWATAAALVAATVPAMTYGSVTGHVEPRVQMFVVMAVACLLWARAGGSVGYVIVAGALAGFYCASKYLGLVFALTGALAVLALWPGSFARRIAAAAAFSVAVAVAGMQWYAFHWWHTGDPVFPMLYAYLGVSDPVYWSDRIDAVFRSTFLEGDRAFEVSPWTLFYYPLAAVFDLHPRLESGRVGPGPFLLLIAPFAVLGWRRLGESADGARVRRECAIVLGLAVGFFVLWFALGSPQRFRHLLPIVPLAVASLTALAAGAATRGAVLRPLAAVFAVTLAFQIAVLSMHTLRPAQAAFGLQGRDAYLSNAIPEYPLVQWLNANLSAGERAFVFYRHYLYYLDVPFVFSHPRFDQIAPHYDDPEFWPAFKRAIERHAITHVVMGPPDFYDKPWPAHRAFRRAFETGVLTPIHTGSAPMHSSQTLPGLTQGEASSRWAVYAVDLSKDGEP